MGSVRIVWIMDSLKINYQWRAATARDCGSYFFPHRFTPDFRRDNSRPAIYRCPLCGAMAPRTRDDVEVPIHFPREKRRRGRPCWTRQAKYS